METELKSKAAELAHSIYGLWADQGRPGVPTFGFKEVERIVLAALASGDAEPSAIRELRTSLGEILKLVEDGVLVRNTADDGDFSKFAAQSFKLAGTLKHAQVVLGYEAGGSQEGDSKQ